MKKSTKTPQRPRIAVLPEGKLVAVTGGGPPSGSGQHALLAEPPAQ